MVRKFQIDENYKPTNPRKPMNPRGNLKSGLRKKKHYIQRSKNLLLKIASTFVFLALIMCHFNLLSSTSFKGRSSLRIKKQRPWWHIRWVWHGFLCSSQTHSPIHFQFLFTYSRTIVCLGLQKATDLCKCIQSLVLAYVWPVKYKKGSLQRRCSGKDLLPDERKACR